MSNRNNQPAVPEARDGLNRFKTEVANELGIELKDYNGDLRAKDAGKIGGNMVKKMIKDYESNNLR